MRYRTVIFDLDGVICHTDHYHYLAWKKIADQLHIDFDEKKNNRLRGVSRMESLEIVLEGYSGTLTEDEKMALAEEKNTYYKQLLTQITPEELQDDVKQTLKKLKENGIILAIGSSSKNTKYILRQLGLEGFFHAVSDGNNIVRSKPDPEVFLKAAEFVQADPRECLVVEDAKAGIEAAQRAGMHSAAMGDAILCQMADYNLKKFGDLENIVLT